MSRLFSKARLGPLTLQNYLVIAPMTRSRATGNVPNDLMRKSFKRSLILSGGYDAARAEADLLAGKADLIAVGRPFLATPIWSSGGKRTRRSTSRT